MQNYKVPRYKLYKFEELVSDRDRFIWEVERYIYEEYNTKEVYKQKISLLDMFIQKKFANPTANGLNNESKEVDVDNIARDIKEYDAGKD